MCCCHARGCSHADRPMRSSFFLAMSACMARAQQAGAPRSFTVYSQPIELRFGEVHNRMQGPLPLPPEIISRYARGSNKSMAVHGFQLDVVRIGADGTEASVPLYDHYFHHYILNMGSEQGLVTLRAAMCPDGRCQGMQASAQTLKALQRRSSLGNVVSFGGASGAEFRHNPHDFQAPYRIVVTEPESWAPTIHLINTLRPNTSFDGTPSPLLMCPCTPQRVIDAANGTIDGRAPFPPFGGCSADFMRTNPSCRLSTYVGGWRCCDDGVSLLDTSKCTQPSCAEYPKQRVVLKATFEYADEAADDVPLRPIACCDVTTTGPYQGNIEYDVPQCAAGTPPAVCHMARMHTHDDTRTVMSATRPAVHVSGHALSSCTRMHVATCGAGVHPRGSNSAAPRWRPGPPQGH